MTNSNIEQSPDEIHLNNSEIALKFWMTVPPENVASGLSFWSAPGDGCGTISCFGGWCPKIPEFKAMGLRTDGFGAPKHSNMRLFKPSMIAEYLFGDEDMFAPSHKYVESFGCDYDKTAPKDCTDHELVQHRLEQNIKRLRKLND